jgi:uncharacterized membrane protein YdjX (TVP38/TMEM64 family)
VLKSFVLVIQQLQGKAWAAPVFVFTYALGCLGFPITIFPVAGSILFGFWKGVFFTWMGESLGSSMAFWMARKWARPWVTKALAGRPLPKVLRNPDFTTMLVVRLVGLPPFHLVNYFCGLSQMPYATYLGATMVGMLPWTVILTFFAHFLWDALLEGGAKGLKRELYRQAGPLMLALVLFGMLIGVSAFLGRKFLRQESAGGENSKE